MPLFDVPALIAALSRFDAYPHPVDAVEVHQTHISVVFLAGPFAYKIKKPVNLGFLDFSTLEKRKHFCEEEVRLNRRLAPDVYLGVIPVTRNGNAIRIDNNAPVIEWAVRMKRLPADAMLEHRLGNVTREQIEHLAGRLADFHRHAEANARISSFGCFEVVARNARDNFAQSQASIGATVSPIVFERVRALTESHLERLHDLIETRAQEHVPRDTHGDLRLEHVYFFPNEAPPNDLVIIDCIEFSDRFRFADPIADMAFLAMDLAFHGRRDLARVFADAYFARSGHIDGRELLPFYIAYRAVVRAKVEGIELAEKEIDRDEREAAGARARAHWLLALGELEAPSNRPALMMIAGLPGAGKSTLARAVAASANFEVLRSDVIRKQLAAGAADIYTPQWTEKTYRGLLSRATELLWQGKRVIIDANFRDDDWRVRFLGLARNWAVPALIVYCHSDPAVVESRLSARAGDASDADWSVYHELQASWQPLSDEVRRATLDLNTSGELNQSEKRVASRLASEGLL